VRRLGIGVVTVVLALVAPAVAAAQPACGPNGELQPSARQVATQQDADGSREVTEFFADGAYRVSRCDPGGALTVWMSVGPIADPDLGTVAVPLTVGTRQSVVSFLAGDASDPEWAADWRAARAGWIAQVLPPTAGPRIEVAPALALRGACSDSAWSRYPGAWPFWVYRWRLNTGAFGRSAATTAAMQWAHLHWDDDYNDCGIGDSNILRSTYAGSTGATSHSVADGVSTIDKGKMSSVGCGGFLACTRDFYSTVYPWFAESDQRFSDAVTWTNAGAPGAYDYESVATHETGHTIGLDHETASAALTMWPSITKGSTAARTLGRGDILGVNSVYAH
jgi:hypothetical protein